MNRRVAAPPVVVQSPHPDVLAHRDQRPVTASAALNVILIGPPGAGKGTQAARLARTLGVPTISTGDMLRRTAQSGTAIGVIVKSVMDKGGLIDDQVMTEIVAGRLQESDTHRGFILDGFPRTVEQAVSLDTLLDRRGELLAVELAVPDNLIVARLSQRRVCEACGRNGDPDARSTVCPCGGALRPRSDDEESVVRERLRTYQRSTRPLIDFYLRRSALRAIDGTQAPDLVTAQIARVVIGAGRLQS